MSRELLDIEKTAQRAIKSNRPYLHLFPKPDFQDKAEKEGDARITVGVMAEIVFRYWDDCKLIAPFLRGKNLEDTLRRVWEFWYWHVQYKLDNGEQLRRPARTIHEQIGDCDCFSIAVCQTLLHLDIDNDFAVAKYWENGKKGKWQHVYITVPKPTGGYYTLDCVAHQFDKEQTFADKFTYHMTTLHGIPINVLSGHDNQSSELLHILSGGDFEEVDNMLGLGQIPSADAELDAILKHLISTRNFIQNNPQTVITAGGAAAHLQMLNHAIDNWYTPNRDRALEQLAQEEERWNEHSGLTGIGDEGDEIDGLGARRGKKKFWGKVKEAVKKVGAGVKKGVQKAGQAIKNVGKAIIKYNPLSLAVRGGFLLAMKINLLGMASQLIPALFNEGEARRRGISKERWEKSKRALEQIEKMFVNKLQGQKDKLHAAIRNGRAARGLAGFGSLGEPATITSIAASAVPIIEAAKTLNSAGLTDKGGKFPEEKTGLISKVKEWWKKAFGKQNAVANETVSNEEKAADEDFSPSDADTNVPAPNERNTSDDSDKDGSDQEGGWAKIKRFVSDNPGAVTIGVVILGAAITAGVVHHRKKKEAAAQQPKELPQPNTSYLPASNSPATPSAYPAIHGYKRKRKEPNPTILK